MDLSPALSGTFGAPSGGLSPLSFRSFSGLAGLQPANGAAPTAPLLGPPAQPTQPGPNGPTPVQAGDALRHNDQMAQLQRDNFPEYARQLAPTLAPQDRANPFAYSLGQDVPIEVKRQVFAEYQAGLNAPRTEISGMSGSNATYDERAGPNGTIRVNGDLFGADPSRPGQMEAFAAWGHMEEIGHWGDARAQQLMGRPGGDSIGDEGARYALIASGSVAQQAQPGSMLANYTIPVTGGPARTVQVDTSVLKALGAEKLANGSFARENRTGGVENFGPEGHYQTTYITAAAAGRSMGMSPQQVDQMANRIALGSQLPDMLENYDATTQFTDKLMTQWQEGLNGPNLLGPPAWTPQDQQHLENVYEGLHALPRPQDANPAWQASERQQTSDFIRDRIGAGDYVTAGVAIHRLGDLSAHVQPGNGLPYSGDIGHGLDGHTPDQVYTNGPDGRAAPWAKVTDYQSTLSNVIAGGLTDQARAAGRPLAPDAEAKAAGDARTAWRGVYDSALAQSREYLNPQPDWSYTLGANASTATGDYFHDAAAAYIQGVHDLAAVPGSAPPLTDPQTGVGGGYIPSPAEIGSLDNVERQFQPVR